MGQKLSGLSILLKKKIYKMCFSIRKNSLNKKKLALPQCTRRYTMYKYTLIGVDSGVNLYTPRMFFLCKLFIILILIR